MRDFPRQLIDLLELHATSIAPDLRTTICKALILLRNRQLIAATTYERNCFLRIASDFPLLQDSSCFLQAFPCTWQTSERSCVQPYRQRYQTVCFVLWCYRCKLCSSFSCSVSTIGWISRLNIISWTEACRILCSLCCLMRMRSLRRNHSMLWLSCTRSIFGMNLTFLYLPKL